MVPVFERLIASGRIGAWGISGLGVPSAVIQTFNDDSPRTVLQAIANLLDSEDESYGPPEPGPRAIIASAQDRGVAVMGIRAVQAGALTDSFDRNVSQDQPLYTDFLSAEPFRVLAREIGESPA